MDRMRGVANAVLLATLMKPVARRMVATWRRRARESAAASVGIPLQELLETALVEELSASAELTPSLAEATEESADTGMARTLLTAGVAIALSLTVAIAVAAVIRRRRARAAEAERPEWVAVPMGAAAEEAEAAVAAERAS